MIFLEVVPWTKWTICGIYNLAYAFVFYSYDIYKCNPIVISHSKEIYGYPEIIGTAGYSGTIELPTPSPTSTTSSGGGGGDGSVPSGEEFKNIELKK